MATIRTLLHAARIVDQIRQNLISLQSDMVRNATTWKAMAQAQSPTLVTLQGYMHTAATSYLTRLGWYTTLQGDPVKRQRVLDELARRGWTEADITDIGTALNATANQLDGAALATYAACITACDGIIAAVSAPDTLWPE